MSTIDTSQWIKTPMYFHREYQNDIKLPTNEQLSQPDLSNDKDFYDNYNITAPTDIPNNSSRLDLAKRVAFASLPFFSLYQPFSLPMALILGSARVLTAASELHAAAQKGQDTSNQMIQTAIAVAALAGTILAHPLGMLMTTGQDIVLDCRHTIHALSEGDYNSASKRMLSLVNNALYLGLFFTGSVELSIASFSIQVISGLYHSSKDFKNGRWIEGTAQLAMTAIRANQLAGQIKLLHIESLVEKEKKIIDVCKIDFRSSEIQTQNATVEVGPGVFFNRQHNRSWLMHWSGRSYIKVTTDIKKDASKEYSLDLTHLSSLVRGKSLSYITIRVNNQTVATNFNPDMGYMVGHCFDVTKLMQNGKNEIKISFDGKSQSNYWIAKLDITAK